jgi:hypothetical protein
LLSIRQIGAASMLLAVQCAAVAVSAALLHHPMMAVSPLLFAAGIWFVPDHFVQIAPQTVPVGGARLGVGAAALVAILCQSQGVLALPLALMLLGVLLAATRRHQLMQVIALVGIQNGVVLTACLTTSAGTPLAIVPLAACVVLPLPLALGVLLPMLVRQTNKGARWLPWLDLGLSLAVFAATFLVPLDSVASVFAPLLGLDAVVRSYQRRKRERMAATARGLALLTSLFLVLAVCQLNPILAWFAVFAAITTSSLPTLARRWNATILAFLGAGIALFGLLLVMLAPSVLGYFSVFTGFVAMAAIIPDLAAVLVIVILRLADLAPWPPAADALGLAITMVTLLVCAASIRGKSLRSSVPLLQQAEASVAAMSICLGQADGRFAAFVMLILVILTRTAARIPDGPVTGYAIAGLGGVPPFGVFPGLVLVVLAMINRDAWLLLPLGAAYLPILLASTSAAPIVSASSRALPSVGWLPLAIALLVGYFTPDGLARWWHVLTAGGG